MHDRSLDGEGERSKPTTSINHLFLVLKLIKQFRHTRDTRMCVGVCCLVYLCIDENNSITICSTIDLNDAPLSIWTFVFFLLLLLFGARICKIMTLIFIAYRQSVSPTFIIINFQCWFAFSIAQPLKIEIEWERDVFCCSKLVATVTHSSCTVFVYSIIHRKRNTSHWVEAVGARVYFQHKANIWVQFNWILNYNFLSFDARERWWDDSACGIQMR